MKISIQTIEEILEHHGVKAPTKGAIIRDFTLIEMGQNQKPDSPVFTPFSTPRPVEMPQPVYAKPVVTCGLMLDLT